MLSFSIAYFDLALNHHNVYNMQDTLKQQMLPVVALSPARLASAALFARRRRRRRRPL
jgi:hypothetical protein